jgi:hypothetical protein
MSSTAMCIVCKDYPATHGPRCYRCATASDRDLVRADDKRHRRKAITDAQAEVKRLKNVLGSEAVRDAALEEQRRRSDQNRTHAQQRRPNLISSAIDAALAANPAASDKEIITKLPRNIIKGLTDKNLGDRITRARKRRAAPSL